MISQMACTGVTFTVSTLPIRLHDDVCHVFPTSAVMSQHTWVTAVQKYPLAHLLTILRLAIQVTLDVASTDPLCAIIVPFLS